MSEEKVAEASGESPGLARTLADEILVDEPDPTLATTKGHLLSSNDPADSRPSSRLRKAIFSSSLVSGTSDVAQIVTALAGFSYGFGWLMAVRFFTPFDVAPEEAGIDFLWIAIRAIFVTLAGLAMILTARVCLVYAGSFTKRVSVIRSLRAIKVLTVLGCSILGLVAGMVVLLVFIVLGQAPVLGWIVAVVMTVLGLVIGLLVNHFRPPSGPLEFTFSAQIWLRAVGTCLIVVVIVVVAALPFILGSYYADMVRDGHAVHLGLFPGVRVFDTPEVTLRPASTSMPSASLPAHCVLRLGESGGTSIYYDPVDKSILRISDLSVVVVQSCASSA